MAVRAFSQGYRKETTLIQKMATALVCIVILVIVLSLALRFALRQWVRRIRPSTRYTLFAFLLGLVVSSNGGAGIMEAVDGQLGLATLFFLSTLAFAFSCILEMRKLSQEF